MKPRAGEFGPQLKVRGTKQWWEPFLPIVQCLLAKNKRMLHRIVDEFHRMCKRRKLNAGNSKVTIFGNKREQTIEFAKPYGARVENTFEVSMLFSISLALEPAADKNL